MLEIDIKLNPFGLGSNIRTIGNIFIANVTRKTTRNTRQDYVYVIHNQASRYNDEEIIHGVIYGHDQNQSTTKLLKAIMDDYGASACRLSEGYAHGRINEVKPK